MILAWVLFSFYLGGTAWLGWLGYKRTKNFASFAIGAGDLSPFVVAITMAASVASAATFIINPGFIYVHGLAAFMHFVVAVGCGFCLMLALLSFRFRRLGEENKALTMPQWIGKRYGSKGFALFFAVINLFAFAFVVLIVGGLSIVMQQLLGLSNIAALLIILGFVTSYVFLGGTYAHVFTNTLQGSLMLVVTILILASGVHLFFTADGGFWQQLAQQDVNLVKFINPASSLYDSGFSIYISGFLIGAALVCQPHILTKALYLKSDRAIRRYLLWGTAILFLFFLLPFVGFYARLIIPPEQLIDAATGSFRQDMVMAMYIKNAFPDWLFTTISVVLIAAGMSTLDGILVALSTITANDLILNLLPESDAEKSTEGQRLAKAYKLSHLALVAIAILAFLVCLNPPRLLGIFGQIGVYGMAVAAVPPLLLGIFFRDVPLKIVAIAAILALLAHFGLYLFGQQIFPNTTITFANPGVTAAIALLISVPFAFFGVLLSKKKTMFDLK